jgi:hypothetical protein
MRQSPPTRLAPASHDVRSALKADILGGRMIALIKERVTQAALSK